MVPLAVFWAVPSARAALAFERLVAFDVAVFLDRPTEAGVEHSLAAAKAGDQQAHIHSLVTLHPPHQVCPVGSTGAGEAALLKFAQQSGLGQRDHAPGVVPE